MLAAARNDRGIGIGHAAGLKAGIDPKGDNHSPYMKAVRASYHGEPVCFCPFGCTVDDVDEFGRCYHIVGTSPDGKHIEPLVMGADGRLRTVVKREVVNGRAKPVLERVNPKRHHLERITTTSWVYEDRPCPPEWGRADLVDDDLYDDDTDPTDDEEDEKE